MQIKKVPWKWRKRRRPKRSCDKTHMYCTSKRTLNNFFFFFVYFRAFLGANDAPHDWLQYVLWIGSQTKFLTKLWTFEKSRVWSVCMVTLLGARFAMTKPPFDQKPTPPINFWTLEMGLSCSARVRRLTGILRRAHVTIFIVDYVDFQSQLSGFSRIFEDFDWAPVIFTQDVQRKTYWIFLWKYFFSKNQKSVTVVLRRIEFCVGPPWPNFRKLSQFSINGRIWPTFRLRLLVQ